MERSAVGGTALCDVVVRRGPVCARGGGRGGLAALSEGGGEQCGVGSSGWRMEAPGH